MNTKTLMLKALITLNTLPVFAGGAVSLNATEEHVCGNNIVIGKHYAASASDNNTSSVKPADILASGSFRLEIRDPQIIERFKTMDLVEDSGWDKTAFYKDLNKDINKVPDAVVLLVNNGKVTSVGGGRIDYKLTLPLAPPHFTQLPVVMLGAAPKTAFDVSYKQTVGNNFELQFDLLTGEVKKCVEFGIGPNPAVELGFVTSPATTKQCLKTEVVHAQSADLLVKDVLSVDADSCTIPTPHTFL